jgi:hypothetical protein
MNIFRNQTNVQKEYLDAKTDTPLGELRESILYGDVEIDMFKTADIQNWSPYIFSAVFWDLMIKKRITTIKELCNFYPERVITLEKKDELANEIIKNNDFTTEILNILKCNVGVKFTNKYIVDLIHNRHIEGLMWLVYNGENIEFEPIDANDALNIGWLEGLQYICIFTKPTINLVNLFRSLNDTHQYDSICDCICWLLQSRMVKVTVEDISRIKNKFNLDRFKSFLPQ